MSANCESPYLSSVEWLVLDALCDKVKDDASGWKPMDPREMAPVGLRMSELAQELGLTRGQVIHAVNVLARVGMVGWVA